MKRTIALFVLVFTLLPLCFSSEAIEKELKYNREAKNEWLALGGAWFCPSLGHFYAGDWGRSLPMVGTTAAGFAVYIAGAQAYNDSGDTSTLFLGLGLVLFGRIWEYVDVFNTVADDNKALKEDLGLTFHVINGNLALASSYQF